MEEARKVASVSKKRAKECSFWKHKMRKESPLYHIDGHQASKKCRGVIRCDVVKDDSGSHPVITGKCSFASHMTAATSNGCY